MRHAKPKDNQGEFFDKVSDEISVREAGRRGGIVTRERHGVEFYRQIGSKGGGSTKKLYSHLFSELGKKGGRPKRPALNESMGGEDHY
jgi:general stress protein YciG